MSHENACRDVKTAQIPFALKDIRSLQSRIEIGGAVSGGRGPEWIKVGFGERFTHVSI